MSYKIIQIYEIITHFVQRNTNLNNFTITEYFTMTVTILKHITNAFKCNKFLRNKLIKLFTLIFLFVCLKYRKCSYLSTLTAVTFKLSDTFKLFNKLSFQKSLTSINRTRKYSIFKMTKNFYCNFQITLLKQIGIWPVHHSYKFIIFLQKLFLYSTIVILFFISVGLLGATIFSKDLKNVSSTIDIATLTMSATYKICFMVYYIKKFQNLISFMDSKFKYVVGNRKGDFISLKTENRYCNLYTILLCGSGALSTIFYSFVPILEKKDNFNEIIQLS